MFLYADILSYGFLDWLYDCAVVHTPTTFSRSSQDNNVEIDAEEGSGSYENDHRKILEQALRETGCNDRIWMTSSFSTMHNHSQMNFLCQMDKIIQHVIKILAPDDYNSVNMALVERSMKKMKRRIETKFGYVA